MTVSYTVDELVARVQRAAQITTDNPKLPTADIVNIADEEIQTILWPLLRSTAEDYGVEKMKLTVPYVNPATDPLGLAGSARLPPYASSSTIVSVFYLDSNAVPYELPRWDLQDSPWSPQVTVQNPAAYALRGDTLVLCPPPNQATDILVMFEARPNRLVLVAQGGSFSVPSGQPLDAWDPGPSAPTGARIDLIAAQPPLGVIARYLKTTGAGGPPPPYPTLYSSTIGDLSASGFAYDASTHDTTAGLTQPVGYWCVSGTTCVFPLPDAWWPLAINQITLRACVEIGDANGAATLAPLIEERKRLVLAHSDNRARKQPKILFDGRSPLRGRAWGYWR